MNKGIFSSVRRLSEDALYISMHPESGPRSMPADGMQVAIEISRRELRHVQLATRKITISLLYRQHITAVKFKCNSCMSFAAMHEFALGQTGRLRAPRFAPSSQTAYSVPAASFSRRGRLSDITPNLAFLNLRGI
jgi:hypothetical protein